MTRSLILSVCLFLGCGTGHSQFVSTDYSNPSWKPPGASLLGSWSILDVSTGFVISSLEIRSGANPVRLVDGVISNVVISQGSRVIIEYPMSDSVHCVLYLVFESSGYYRGWAKLLDPVDGSFTVVSDVVMVGGL